MDYMNELQNCINESRDIMKDTIKMGERMASILTDFGTQVSDLEDSLNNNNLMALSFSHLMGKDGEYEYVLSIEKDDSNKKKIRLFGEMICIYNPEKSIKRPIAQMKIQQRLLFISFLPDFLSLYNEFVESNVNGFIKLK